MPPVEIPDNIEQVFEAARRLALGATRPLNSPPANRNLILVTPGRMIIQHPCPPNGSVPQEQIAPITALLPPDPRRNVAVIAYTQLEALRADVAQAIPFAGLLAAFAYIGHNVWVFEGHVSALAAGLRQADLLIVDSGMLPYLAPHWREAANAVMRHAEVYIHDRETYSLKPVP
jgi:hypothetical protein